MKRLMRQLALGLALAAAAALPAAAQDFPNRPIKLAIPFAPGGATDVLARLFAEELGMRLGQTVVPENRPGASTGVAASYVAKSRADGYTLLFSTPTHAINGATSPNLNFDSVADFEFIGKLGEVGFVLLASPQLKVKDMGALVAMTKTEPGKLQYGSSGNNTQGHLWTEAMLQQAGGQALHVPYKGEIPALTDLMGGQLHFFLCTLTACGSRLTDGTLTALAVTSSRRFPGAPQVPTVAEAGFPASQVAWWPFVAAPKGTPAPVVQKLNAAVNDMLSDEKFRTRLQASGIDPEPRTTPASVRSLVQSEVDRWRQLAAKMPATK